MDKKKILIIGFIAFLGVINILVWVSPYITNIPINGFCHRARSISFDEPIGIPNMGELHGLTETEAGALSTAAGYPDIGTIVGTGSGLDGPWGIWTDWEDNDSFMGKELVEETDIFAGMKSFCYFNAFYIEIPVEGEYHICVGSDDGMILFMDGVRIAEYLGGERSCQIDDDFVTKNLTVGNHYFLMIVYQVKSTTGFTIRIKNATLNATHLTDPATAPVMAWDFKTKTQIEVNALGVITGAVSIALICAVFMVDHYTKRRI